MVEAVQNTANEFGSLAPAIAAASGAALMLAAATRVLRRRTAASARIFVALALFAVAMRLIAASVGEFQTLGLLPIAGADVPTWLATLAGNPTREAMAIQAALVVAAYALLARTIKRHV
ncbi:MAG: hypothetical protein LCH62_19485 [Proteobacteria bacterium]|nr:hypothetical protein [Pseudomonadota bacterium]